jgi:hypothetical protein
MSPEGGQRGFGLLSLVLGALLVVVGCVLLGGCLVGHWLQLLPVSGPSGGLMAQQPEPVTRPADDGMKHPAVEALWNASKGLRMPSETDVPFEPFLWDDGGDMTAERLPQLARIAEGATVEEDTIDNLWRTVPSEDRAKFQKLVQAIEEQLSGVKVFRVGNEPAQDIYIVGKTKDGKLAGLKTSVVET